MKKIILLLILLVLLQAIGCTKTVEPDISEEPDLNQEEAPEMREENEEEALKDEEEIEIEAADEEEEEEEVDALTASQVMIFQGFPMERISLIEPEIVHTVEIYMNKLEPQDINLNHYRLIYLTQAEEDEVYKFFEELIDIDETNYSNFTGTIDGLYASGSYVDFYDDFAEREFRYVDLKLGLEPEEMGIDNPYFEFAIRNLIDLPDDTISTDQIYQNSINIYEDNSYSTQHIEGFNSSLSAEEIFKFYQDFTSGKDNLDYYEDESSHVLRWSQGKHSCDLRIRKEKMALASDFYITIQEKKNFND
ncbi:MAG: hypothetical protein GXZ13_07470 [Synergistaceae bacterium]|nr:hypothetical protein [Synergistaceae bacterium]